jgi:hypothetical protein
MNEEETYYRRVQKYEFGGPSGIVATINLPFMKGFIAIPGVDATVIPATMTVTALDPTGATLSIDLSTWDKNDPNNNLTSNSGYAGMGMLEDNSILGSGVAASTFTFYPYIITRAIATYDDTPLSNCTIYALL